MTEDSEKFASPKKPELKTATMTEFLESVPPSAWREIPEGFSEKPDNSASARLCTPDIHIHCEQCEGPRVFRLAEDNEVFFGRGERVLSTFLDYMCANCRTEWKRFAVMAIRTDTPGEGRIYKYGEQPAFGPPTPTRLIELFGKDRDLFFMGRRCESQGLGIGAFAYYRRVVESHKKQIFDEIIKVATTVGLNAERMKSLEQAAGEQQFSKAVEAVKDAIPQTLLIQGHNPLVLLYKALSAHLHEKTDAECLALAQDIRTILVELAEKIGAALKDNADIASAVKRLAQP